jgi:hypothetical protein
MSAFEEPRYVCAIAGATAAVLGEPDLAPACWAPDLRAHWLGCPPIEGGYRHRSHTFPVGGMTTLVEGDWIAWLDHGPLGFPDLGAHGHADALSVWLHVDGVPVLVDAGTYAYNGSPETRRWFRGSAAHNTATVDGGNQSEPLGSFLWKRRAKAWVIAAQTGEAPWVRAATDAWGEIAHERRLSLSDGQLHLTDHFDGAGTHTLRIRLHFSAQLDVVPTDGGFDVRKGSERLLFLAAGGTLVRSRRAPAYGHLTEGTTWILETEEALPWSHTLSITR